jgi:hypothetical protein
MIVLFCVRIPDELGVLGCHVVKRITMASVSPIEMIQLQQYWLLGKDSVIRYSL